MDLTLLWSALTGIAAGIIGAVIGGVFALKATKRQIEVMLEQGRGDVNERLYSQSLEIMRFLAEHPELRPYFYNNKELREAANELEKLRVLSADEMASGFMELVALQLSLQPEHIQPRWKAYLVDQYNSSVVVREHLAECAGWYADDLLCLLPIQAVEVAKEKASAKAV